MSEMCRSVSKGLMLLMRSKTMMEDWRMLEVMMTETQRECDSTYMKQEAYKDTNTKIRLGKERKGVLLL
jgi:hypothetical protein